MLWSQLKEEETRLVFSWLQQQHKSKHCKLIFSTWFLVTTCSNVKGNSSISVYAISDTFSTCCMYLFSFYRKLSITIITHYSLPAKSWERDFADHTRKCDDNACTNRGLAYLPRSNARRDTCISSVKLLLNYFRISLHAPDLLFGIAVQWYLEN